MTLPMRKRAAKSITKKATKNQRKKTRKNLIIGEEGLVEVRKNLGGMVITKKMQKMI
jgi:hypothetical protein